jgi:hypothetical protein
MSGGTDHVVSGRVMMDTEPLSGDLHGTKSESVTG